MDKPDNIKTGFSYIKRYALLLVLIWSIIIVALLLINEIQTNKEIQEYGQIYTHAAFDRDVIYRRWAAMHGGVYVPVTNKTPPNPYLSHVSERDVTTLSGKQLTLMNPAYMTRQVYEFEMEFSKARSHITSLNPIKPENAPDEWEKQALIAFENGVPEVSSIEIIDGREYFRLIRPFITEKACLKCHGQQGYKIGDIRGGISISVPVDSIKGLTDITHSRNDHIYILLWLLGICGIAFGYFQMSKSESKRTQAEIKLEMSFHDMEKTVKKRTGELDQVNAELRKDIAKREKTELALQKSEELYRHLVELSPDGIIVHDLERYTFVNNATSRILGAKRAEELIGRKILDFVHPDYLDIAKQRLSEEKDGKILPFIEEKMLKIDGTSVDVEVAAFPATHMGAIEVHAIVRDITDRKHAQEELIKSETKFRNYFEKGVVGVAITSPEKGWVEVNDYLCELLGYTNDEIVAKTWAEMTYPEDLAPDVEQFDRMLSGEIDSYSMEKRFIHKNGSVISTIMSVACVCNKTGDVDYCIASIQDISKLKQVEDEIHKLNEELEQHVEARTADLNESQQALMSIVEDLSDTTTDLENANQRLLELDQLKSMFIASTSHELRTPLNSIIGFTSILLEGWSGELNPEQKEQLDIVHASGQHLLSLINDVIDISKIEAGKIAMYMEEFNLKDVVDEAVSIVMPQINEKKLTFTVDAPDITMTTDYHRLLQCILNLLSNAIKFTESGDITLTAKTIKNIVDISIMDTGIGMKEQDIPRLFTPFTRLDTPLTAKTTGTGLGLYLTQKLVKEGLSGTIDVKSTYGEGSTFTMHIPIKSEDKT